MNSVLAVTLSRRIGPIHRNHLEAGPHLRNDAGTVRGESEHVNGEMERGRGPFVIAALAAVCGLGALVHQFTTPADVAWGWAFRGFIVVIGAPYVLVGLAIRLRTPENPIGKLLEVMGFSYMFAGAISEYAVRGLVVDPGSLPGAIYAAWILQWLWIVMFGLSMFVFLLFPNGRYLSSAWRKFRIVAAASLVVAAAGTALGDGVLDSFAERPAFQNPLGLESWSADAAASLLSVWLLCLLASATSLFIRFKRSSGVERLQLKWLAVGGLFTALSFVIAGFGEGVLGVSVATSAITGQVLVTLGIFILPTTIGIAILRYRLYDIDVLINRALVYTALTAMLAGAYIGLVFTFQALLSPFTAESDLAIAASTLGVAALFGPARSRLQDFIDRRFYRRKFDTEKTIEGFSSRLRDEVELGAVSRQLVEVVSTTMQPAHVSLWLKEKSV